MKQNLKVTIKIIFCILALNIKAQITTQWGPNGFVKIEEGSGGFFANLDPGDRFSRDHDTIGDLNADGVTDLIVGARSDDDGATDAGAVYILFMNSDGTVQNSQKISMLEGNFNESLNPGNFFGYGVAGIGDYNGDSIPDIAVSSPVPPNRAIYIIHLNRNGTVKDFVKNLNITAQGLSSIGDLNGDGRIDLVACDPGSDIGGTDIGAIRILFFNSSSQVIYPQTVMIGPNIGGFGQGLDSLDQFGGREVAMLGDIDGDGTKELAVGAFMSNEGRGAIWILSLDTTSYNVVSKLKITEGVNGFTDTLTTGLNPNGTEGANFGHALCSVGDLNGDGIIDLLTGANQQNEGWGYILYLNSNKTVKTFTRINNSDGGFGLTLNPEERFSRSISFLGDLRGDGTIAVNIGGGAGGTGTLYLLFFKPCEFLQINGNDNWDAGNILFTNWDESLQVLTDDALTFEQCSFKAFENNAPYLTYNLIEGSCICKDSTAILSNNNSASLAFINRCNFIESTNLLYSNTENYFKLYPNPTRNELHLNIGDIFFETEISATIYNFTGTKLSTEIILYKNSKIDISNLGKGIYFLRLENQQIRETLKFLKIQ